MSTSAKHAGLLVFICGFLFFLNLGGTLLWDEDEPRNASCAVEMMERQDWVIPYFNAEIRTHKPILLYWFVISAYKMFGVSEFAARFWSAVLATGTVLLTYSIGRRLFSPRTGLLSGIVLASSLMYCVSARAVTPDSVLMFFSTAALAFYVQGCWPRTDSEQQSAIWFPTQIGYVVAMYAMMGFAVLAKGPVGFIIPTAVIGMFLLIQRLPAAASDETASERSGSLAVRSVRQVGWLLRPFQPIHFLKTCWFMRLGTAVVTVLAVALPWYIWVTIRSDGEWTYGFFVEHNLGRATRPMENHGGLPVIYYLIAISIGLFPWSVFMTPITIDLVRGWKSRRDRAAQTLAVCWVCVYVGMFSIASTKLPSYITPCYPGLALLVGSFLSRLGAGTETVRRGWLQLSFATVTLVGLTMLVAIPIVAQFVLPGAEPAALVGLIPLVGGAACLWMWSQSQRERMIKTAAITSVAFTTALFGLASPMISDLREIDELMAEMKQRSDNPKLVAYGAFRSSWVFYAEKPIPLYGKGSEQVVESFLKESPDHFAVVARSVMSDIQEPYEEITEIPWFLKNDRVVLISRPSSSIATTRQERDQRFRQVAHQKNVDGEVTN